MLESNPISLLQTLKLNQIDGLNPNIKFQHFIT